MKKTIQPGALIAAWDPSALYDKSVRYIQQTTDLSVDDWEYALWSSLSLELLARASLANIHPALLAETDRNASSLISALGFSPTEPKFSPKSISVSEVFRRLASMNPNFTTEYESFGIQHTGRRNSELHSGEVGFDGLKGSSWQPRFYQTCQILLTSMGLTLNDFVGEDEAKAAEAIMTAAADESAKAVKGDISAHTKVWTLKDPSEQTTLSSKADIWASRQSGHRVRCPSCQSSALVSGEAVSSPIQRLDGDDIVERQDYLPSHFECVACGLKISGLSRLTAAGLSDRYTKTKIYNAAEYYSQPPDDWYEYEDDNNE